MKIEVELTDEELKLTIEKAIRQKMSLPNNFKLVNAYIASGVFIFNDKKENK